MKKTIFILIFFPFIVSANFNDGLIGYWPLDFRDTNWLTGTTGYTFDRSGNGNGGTLANMAKSTSPVVGKINQALLFDGTNDLVTIGKAGTAIPVYPNNTVYSISAWYRTLAPSTVDQTIWGEGSSDGSTAFFFLLSYNTVTAGKIAMRLRADDFTLLLNSVESTTVNNNTKWHHVVWVDSNGTAKLYIDGVQDATNYNYTRSGSFTTATRSAIGSLSRVANSDFFNGNIDDVRVYNRVLSAAEVNQLYRQGAGTHQDSLLSALLEFINIF